MLVQPVLLETLFKTILVPAELANELRPRDLRNRKNVTFSIIFEQFRVSSHGTCSTAHVFHLMFFHTKSLSVESSKSLKFIGNYDSSGNVSLTDYVFFINFSQNRCDIGAHLGPLLATCAKHRVVRNVVIPCIF